MTWIALAAFIGGGIVGYLIGLHRGLYAGGPEVTILHKGPRPPLARDE